MGRRARPSLAAGRSRARRAVALLRGAVDELPLLRAALLAGTLRGTSVQVCWTPGSLASPARPLVRELMLDAGLDELSADALRDLLDGGHVTTVMLAPTLWRRLAGALWRRLDRSSVYICRRASLPPDSVVCCADSDATAAGLLDRLVDGLPEPPGAFTLLRALPPPSPWMLGMMAVAGCPPPVEEPWPGGFGDLVGIRELVVRAPAAEAAAEACGSTRTNLLVLGWHQHALPLPGRWLHPTAWRLSTSAPGDVLLVPLDA
jgi:hypothetical protein